MMTKSPSEITKELLDKIDKAVTGFNSNVPDLQRQLYARVLDLLKDLDTGSGTVKNSVENWKKVQKIAAEFGRFVEDKTYQSNVAEFAQAFDTVGQLHHQYFSAITNKFTPSKVLSEIRKQSIDSTVESLTAAGVSANIEPGIRRILSSNITGGGKFIDLVEQLRTYITTDQSGMGVLDRYAKQITTDSLNQFSAQYSATITDDLGLEWYEYLGSNLVTTRDWCRHMTKKRYVHKSEFQTVIYDNVDGVKVCSATIECNQKTKLPKGMIGDTTPGNLVVNRGGWQCGHQFVAVTEEMVPAIIRSQLKFKTGSAPTQTPSSSVSIKAPSSPAGKLKPQAPKSFIDLKKLASYPVSNLNKTVFDKLSVKTDINLDYKGPHGSHYDINTNKIYIKRHSTWQDSPYAREHVIYHEVGHAIHFQRGIVTNTKVDPEFEKTFRDCSKLISGKEQSIMNNLQRLAFDRAFMKKYNYKEEDLHSALMAVADTIGSLTGGLHGFGHDVQYYRRANNRYAEVFAHASEIYHGDSRVWDELAPDLKKLLLDYFSNHVI